MLLSTALGYAPSLGLYMWVSRLFSGTVVARVPLPLPARFRAMLQGGLGVEGLDVSYVSSFSFYLLCYSGLGGIFSLLHGGGTGSAVPEADPEAAAQAAAGLGAPRANPLGGLAALAGGGGVGGDAGPLGGMLAGAAGPTAARALEEAAAGARGVAASPPAAAGAVEALRLATEVLRALEE